jgi:hypothetical protein
LAAHAENSPVLAVVDDAHWLDGSSANALLFAARRLVGDPFAILLAVREGEPSLLDGADLPRLRLHGLDLQGARELLRRRAKNRGEDEVTDGAAGRLHQETGGNPLALLELGEQRSWREDAPLPHPLPVVTSVANSYAQRFGSLASGPRQVLVLLAASDGDDLAVLARPPPRWGSTEPTLPGAKRPGSPTLPGAKRPGSSTSSGHGPSGATRWRDLPCTGKLLRLSGGWRTAPWRTRCQTPKTIAERGISPSRSSGPMRWSTT